MTDDDTLPAVRRWAEQLASRLGLESADVDIDALLGAAGVAARAAVRPAAPVTTYLIGCAVERAGDDSRARARALEEAIAAVRAIAAELGTPT